MKCPSCGAEVPAGGLFCVSCGAMVSGGSTPSPQQDAAQQNSQQYENTQQGYQQFETPQPSYQQYEAPQQPNYQQYEAPQQPNYKQYDNSQAQQGPSFSQGPDPSFQAGASQSYQQGPGPQYQQYQQGYAPMPQGQAGMVISDTFRLFIESVTSPVTAYRSVIDQNRFVQGILLIVLEVLLAFFTFLIHLPVGSLPKSVSEYLNANFRAKIGGIIILVVLCVVVLTVVAAFIFRDKFVQGYTFLGLLGMFGTATAYGSLGFLVMFFFGLFSPLIAGTVAACMVMVWVGQSLMILYEVIGGDENSKMIKSIISVAAVTFIFIILAYLLIKNDIMNSLDSLTSWF